MKQKYFITWIILSVIITILAVSILRGSVLHSIGYAIAAAVLVLVTYRHSLKAMHTMLLSGALLLSTAGWAFDLYSRIFVYDEILHFVIPGAISFILGGLLMTSKKVDTSRALHLVLTSSMGVTLATLWEIAEWIASTTLSSYTIKGLDDTIFDLALGLTGSIIGAAVSYKNDAET